MSNQITHDGVVVGLDGRNVQVQIVQNSACSGCHAKAACTASDSAEKIITADSEGLTYAIGDAVVVSVSNSMALRAVLWAFCVPIVVAFIVLFAVVPLLGEVMACAVTLGALGVYYLIFYLLRGHINTDYVFTLRRR